MREDKSKKSVLSKPEFALPAVGAAIIDKQNRLFLMKSSGKFGSEWIIPGGKVNFGESMVEALKREIREETGICIDECELLGVREYITDRKHFIFIEYIARCENNPTVCLNEEATKFAWFTESELLKLAIAKPTRKFLDERLIGKQIIAP